MSSSILRAATIQSLLKPRSHPLDASRVRVTASLGDQVGLTKLGVHKTTLAPHMKSTVEHYHDGVGLLLCAGEGEDTPVAAGDFIGFPATTRQPHSFQAGEGGLEYLTGGSREPVDVCHYPLIKKALVVNRARGENVVLDEGDGR
ncbi:cupin domain-containing protein [Mycena latifolia]|nr:cupin domain-containing protein [Mycena latifolia]